MLATSPVLVNDILAWMDSEGPYPTRGAYVLLPRSDQAALKQPAVTERLDLGAVRHVPVGLALLR
jgi:hypothetical protein